MLARTEAGSNVAVLEPWKVIEHGLEFGKDPPVRPRTRDQQDEGLGRVVAPFEVDAAAHGLDVEEPHLEFDCGATAFTKEDHIPRALLQPILHPRKGYLRSVGQGRVDVFQERGQASRLSNVPDGRAARVQLDEGIQTEDRADPVKLQDRQVGCLPSFDQPISAAR